MKLRKLLLPLLLVIISALRAQVYVVPNPMVKMFDTDQKKAYDLWHEYLNSWNTNNVNRCNLWIHNEPCDLLESGFFNPSLYQLGFTEQTLSVIPINSDSFEITSLFYWVDEDKHLNTMAITNILATKQQDGKWKLRNNLMDKTMGWTTQKVKGITYHFPSDYQFNIHEGERASIFISQLQKEFNLPKEDISYYIFKNCYDETRLKGFYYLPNLGLNESCGYFDTKNNIVYTTVKQGEYHQHELIHIINKKYPNAHYLLLTGLAVYNDSNDAALGYKNYELFKNLNIYLKKNKITDLDPINFPTFNPKVTNAYLSGSVLIDIILKKGGKSLLLKALETVQSDNDLRKFITNDLHLTEKQYNKTAIEAIESMSREGFSFKPLK